MSGCARRGNVLSCHPEQAFFVQREPALSDVEGDLGVPRDRAYPEQANRAEWVEFFATH